MKRASWLETMEGTGLTDTIKNIIREAPVKENSIRMIEISNNSECQKTMLELHREECTTGPLHQLKETGSQEVGQDL